MNTTFDYYRFDKMTKIIKKIEVILIIIFDFELLTPIFS